MESTINALATELILGFFLGFVVSWSVGLAPAFIYRYLVFRHPINKKKTRWLLAPVVIILAIVFKTIADPSPFGGPAKFNPNPIPWIILYFVGKWIMTRGSKSVFKHVCLLSIFGVFLFLSVGSIFIGTYLNKVIPDEAELLESLQSDPIHLAVAQSDIQKVSELLSAGENPNFKLPNGHTPIITASRLGRADIVVLLLESGADPNCKDNLGWTPLHHSILEESANISVVDLLVKAGANVNAQDHRLRTPLHRAAQYGHIEIVRYLLKVGADPKMKDNNDWTPYERIEYFGTVDQATELQVKEILKSI